MTPLRPLHHSTHEAQGSHEVRAMAGFDLLRQSWLNKAPQMPRGKEYTPPFLHKQRRLRLALKTRQLINEMAKWKIVSSCSSCFFFFFNCESSRNGQHQSHVLNNWCAPTAAFQEVEVDAIVANRRVYRADPGQTAVNSSLPSLIRLSASLPSLSFPLEG